MDSSLDNPKGKCICYSKNNCINFPLELSLSPRITHYLAYKICLAMSCIAASYLDIEFEK